MKKVIVLILSAALMLGLFGGCSSGRVEASTAPTQSGITTEKILDSFEEQMAELSDDYEVTRLPENQLPESGEVYQAVVITDKLLGYSYHLGVWSWADGDAHLVRLSATNEGTAYVALPVFCLYLARSLDLPVSDVQAFYDAFGLPTQQPSGSMLLSGWDLVALGTESIVTFSATYAPK